MKQTLKDLLQKFEYFLNTSIFNFACLAHPIASISSVVAKMVYAGCKKITYLTDPFATRALFSIKPEILCTWYVFFSRNDKQMGSHA